MNSTKEMITKKPADFYNRSNGESHRMWGRKTEIL